MKDFKIINRCRCCHNKNLKMILDLGDMPLANNFHEGQTTQPKYPLQLMLCDQCFHLQLSVVVNPDLMFLDYAYVSGTTKTLKRYFDFFAYLTIEQYKKNHKFKKKPDNILDIACNDGSQLNAFHGLGLKTYGVDPAKNISFDSMTHKRIFGYFDYNTDWSGTKFDIITAQNVFAHVDYVDNFLINCERLLADDGLLYIQTSQADMIINNEWDTIYHEHLSFFSIKSMKKLLERHNLSMTNVFKFDIHGVSQVFEIKKSYKQINSVTVIAEEMRDNFNNLYNVETYKQYGYNAKALAASIRYYVDQYRNEGYKIIGYGAAAKGMTVIGFADLHLDYIIDDNPLKKGKFTPVNNMPIEPINMLGSESPDTKILFVVLAWNFFDEIKQRIASERKNDNDLFLTYFPQIKIEPHATK